MRPFGGCWPTGGNSRSRLPPTSAAADPASRLATAVGTNTALLAFVQRFLWFVCLLGVTACDGGPSGPTVDLNERFTVAVGDTATLDSPRVRLEFVEVSGDSRCPADALCIQGGDAVVRLRATAGTSA